MIATILRVVLGGILAGAFLFIVPFLLFKALIFFFFAAVIFRLFAGRRHFGRWQRQRDFYDHYEIVEERESMNDRFNRNPKQV